MDEQGNMSSIETYGQFLKFLICEVTATEKDEIVEKP